MSIFTSLRSLWRRIKPGPGGEPVSPEYSYRIFWAKQALSWSREERDRIRQEVEVLVGRENFEPNEYLRKYKLHVFGGREHAGASVLVLQAVLREFERIDDKGDLE